jgi:X-Pro dipeptidyl-peptidase
MSRWLYDVDNGIEDEPKALIQREDRSLVEYADWPDPEAEVTEINLGASDDNSIGSLELDAPDRGRVLETIVDDAQYDAADSCTSPRR